MNKLLNIFDFKQKVNYNIEIMSGLTVALALIPEAIAFAFIANLSPLTASFMQPVANNAVIYFDIQRITPTSIVI